MKTKNKILEFKNKIIYIKLAKEDILILKKIKLAQLIKNSK